MALLNREKLKVMTNIVQYTRIRLTKKKFEIGMAVVRGVYISTCCLAFHLSNTQVVATFSSVLVTPRGPCGRKMAT